MLQFIAEIMHPVRYRKVMLNSYAERILFFIFFSFFFFFFFFFFFRKPLQPVPSHPYPAILVGSASSVCVLW